MQLTLYIKNHYSLYYEPIKNIKVFDEYDQLSTTDLS